MLPMSVSLILALGLGVLGYVIAPRRAVAAAGGDARKLAALPRQYGLNTLLAVLVPSFAILIAGSLAGAGLYLGWAISIVAFIGFAGSLFKITPDYRARTHA
ncbi:MAG: phosphate ABC transporter permease family protein, partial [Rhodobacterales bacterium]